MSVCVPTTFSSFTLTIYHLYWWADFAIDFGLWCRVAAAYCSKPARPKASLVYAAEDDGLPATLPPGAMTVAAAGGPAPAAALSSAMVLPPPPRQKAPKPKVELQQLTRVVHAQAKRT